MHGKNKDKILLSVFAGFVAVFDYHKQANIADLYSLHSWCGVATFSLFCIQVHTYTHTHTLELKSCRSHRHHFTPPLLLLVAHGFAVLPVSVCVGLVTSLLSPRARVLWSGSAGFVHRLQSAGHRGETPLRHHVRPADRPSACILTDVFD